METAYYLNKFQRIADRFDIGLLNEKQLEVTTGVWLNSVVLKLQKEAWRHQSEKGEASIFFSVWINYEAVNGSKIFYNIYALKLRELKGYFISSREFAIAFRERFSAFEERWPNVSTQYGPQTLMQGWQTIDLEDFDAEVVLLVNQFLQIDFIISGLLAERKSSPSKTISSLT